MQPQRKPTVSRRLPRSPQSVQRRGHARRPRQWRLHGAATKRTNVCSQFIYHACNTHNANHMTTYRAFGHPAGWPSPGCSYSHCWSRPQCTWGIIFSDIFWCRFSLPYRTFLSHRRPPLHKWILSPREVQFHILLTATSSLGNHSSASCTQVTQFIP
jgi:hypothetical protein